MSVRRLLPLVLAFGISWLSPSIVGQTTKKNQPNSKKAVETPKGDQRLSLDQVRRLIGIRTPDGVLAQEISSRGISNDYNRRDIDELRRQGAGPETLAALEHLIPLASLTVVTDPGTSVKLDAGAPLQAGANGAVTLSGVEPGPHQLAVEKLYYKSVLKTVTLKARENATVEAKLDWAVGFLSVTTDVTNAQITVVGSPGSAPQVGRLDHFALPIGFSTIVVTAPLRKTNSQTVSIEPGKETTVSVSLPIDPDAVAEAANRIHIAFRGRNYTAVFQQSAVLLQIGVQDKDVLGDVALGHLERGDYAEFPTAAQQALTAGAHLRFSLTHIELGVLKPYTHSAELELSKEGLGFRPVGRCNHQPFQIRWTQVRVDDTKVKFLGLSIVSLIVPNSSNQKKDSTLNMGTDNEGRSDAIRALVDRMSK